MLGPHLVRDTALQDYSKQAIGVLLNGARTMPGLSDFLTEMSSMRINHPNRATFSFCAVKHSEAGHAGFPGDQQSTPLELEAKIG